VILVSYCLRVLHPYMAHCQCLLTGGSFYRFSSISVLRTPHAMSHRVSLVKHNPLNLGHYIRIPIPYFSQSKNVVFCDTFSLSVIFSILTSEVFFLILHYPFFYYSAHQRTPTKARARARTHTHTHTVYIGLDT
jgi:hypothetical protein